MATLADGWPNDNLEHQYYHEPCLSSPQLAAITASTSPINLSDGWGICPEVTTLEAIAALDNVAPHEESRKRKRAQHVSAIGSHARWLLIIHQDDSSVDSKKKRKFEDDAATLASLSSDDEDMDTAKVLQLQIIELHLQQREKRRILAHVKNLQRQLYLAEEKCALQLEDHKSFLKDLLLMSSSSYQRCQTRIVEELARCTSL